MRYGMRPRPTSGLKMSPLPPSASAAYLHLRPRHLVTSPGRIAKGAAMDEREELEHVPWADLMAEAEPEDRRRKTIYLGVAIVGAMVLGVFVARSWWVTPTASTPLAPGDTAVA